MDMFMKLGTISGEAQDTKHKGEIDILAWNWGLHQTGTMHMATGGGTGKVTVQDLSFTKYSDKASPTIMQFCTKGEHMDKATLTVRKAGGDALEYYTITLEDVIISSFSTGGSGGEERFTENVTLNFAKFQVMYQPQNAKGAKEGGPVKATWNIPANAES
jgi:type VI secretion system secreted protein Hcp